MSLTTDAKLPRLEPAMAYVDLLQFDPGRVQQLQKVFIRWMKSGQGPV